MTLQPDSVRVSGASTQAVQLLGVRTESVRKLESAAPEVARIEAQIKKLQRQQRRYQDQLAAVKLKLQAVEYHFTIEHPPTESVQGLRIYPLAIDVAY